MEDVIGDYTWYWLYSLIRGSPRDAAQFPCAGSAQELLARAYIIVVNIKTVRVIQPIQAKATMAVRIRQASYCEHILGRLGQIFLLRGIELTWQRWGIEHRWTYGGDGCPNEPHEPEDE